MAVQAMMRAPISPKLILLWIKHLGTFELMMMCVNTSMSQLLSCAALYSFKYVALRLLLLECIEVVLWSAGMPSSTFA